MSEPDLFDRIANQAADQSEYDFADLSAPYFAAAFRAEFSQRTCATCQEDATCMIQRAAWAYQPDKLLTFSCSLWSPKAAEREP